MLQEGACSLEKTLIILFKTLIILPSEVRDLE